MPDRKLDKREIDCLQRIAAGQYESSTSPCPWYVLDQLLALGLIEQDTRILLPLPLLRRSFRLTQTGMNLLLNQPRRSRD